MNDLPRSSLQKDFIIKTKTPNMNRQKEKSINFKSSLDNTSRSRTIMSSHDLRSSHCIIPKLKPSDIEKLYEENIDFKIAYNKLLDENTKLRTKIQQIQKKQEKAKPETSQNPQKGSLVESLKSMIQDLKTELNKKNKEISELKQYIRYTRMQEIQADAVEYYKECKRLRGIIEEIHKEKGFVNGLSLYEDLRAEIQRLKKLNYSLKPKESSPVIKEDDVQFVDSLNDSRIKDQKSHDSNKKSPKTNGQLDLHTANPVSKDIPAQLLTLQSGNEEHQKLSQDDLFEVFKAKATFLGVRLIDSYIYNFFYESQVSESDIINLCKNGVFQLDQANTNTLISVLLGNSISISRERCISLIKERFVNWTPLTIQEIREISNRIRASIKGVYEQLQDNLKILSGNSPVVPIQALVKELKNCELLGTVGEETCAKSIIFYYSEDLKNSRYLEVLKIFSEGIPDEFFRGLVYFEDMEDLRRSLTSFESKSEERSPLDIGYY